MTLHILLGRLVETACTSSTARMLMITRRMPTAGPHSPMCLQGGLVFIATHFITSLYSIQGVDAARRRGKHIRPWGRGNTPVNSLFFLLSSSAENPCSWRGGATCWSFRLCEQLAGPRKKPEYRPEYAPPFRCRHPCTLLPPPIASAHDTRTAASRKGLESVVCWIRNPDCHGCLEHTRLTSCFNCVWTTVAASL